jgi:hypothetical protein
MIPLVATPTHPLPQSTTTTTPIPIEDIITTTSISEHFLQSGKMLTLENLP